MLRTILSYLVLILVPAVSLAIAVVPYVWVKKYANRRELGREPTQSNEFNQRESAFHLRISALQLWGAFLVGLAGNVAWWGLVFWITNDKISIYLQGADVTGIMFGFFALSILIVITPFIFYKLRHEHFTGKAIIYNIIISLITAGLVFGVWIVLAIVAYRGLFYRLN